MNGIHQYTAAGTVPENVWVHLAATYNHQTGITKLFINGAEQGSVRISGNANKDMSQCK